MKENSKQKQFTVLAIGISIILVVLVILLTSSSNNPPREQLGISNNVTIQEDLQVIRVTSQMGGYTPRIIYAEKDIPTILEIESVNSYGCERAFRIPSLNISEELPSQGITTFDLGTPNTEILGTCSMGMYTFLIEFI